jgi:hypothetical protein
MSVKDDLPQVTGWETDYILSRFTHALGSDRMGNTESTIYHSRYALAMVRAWRKSLLKQDQGVRQGGFRNLRDRGMLREAIRTLTRADAYKESGNHYGEVTCLRTTEAYLRELIKRHQ